MRNSRHDAALIEECAAAHSVSVRAVRNWRTKEDPRWREFVRSRAQDATFSFARPEASAKPMTPDEAETAAAVRVSRLSSLCDQAEANGNINSLGTLIKNTTDAHKLWIIAAENNLKLATASGKLVEVAKVSEFILGNLAMAKQLMENLPDILASRIDSAVDVSAITREEVHVILRELAVSSRSTPWSTPSPDVTGTAGA
jgi:hypothetical protein